MEENPGSIPGSGRSLGEGNGHPLHYFYLENYMDRKAWHTSTWGCKESDTTERSTLEGIMLKWKKVRDRQILYDLTCTQYLKNKTKVTHNKTQVHRKWD